jgi:hypothetical protein
MAFSITFHQTGDSIPFVPTNQEVCEFYIHNLDEKNLNNFFAEDPSIGIAIQHQLQQIKSCVDDVNQWLQQISDIKFDARENLVNYLDQNLLNKLHADWVNSQNALVDIKNQRKKHNYTGLIEKVHDLFPDDIQYPTLISVIQQIGNYEEFCKINHPLIHGIERAFNAVKFAANQSWAIVADNPFSKNILSNDIANLSLTFHHLGRSLYEKFINFDMHLEHNDENSFDQLLGYVTLSLRQTQTIPHSKEYTDWCSRNRIEPRGAFFNLGNIPNLYNNLTKYRIIIFQNLLNNNPFSILKT